MISIRFLLLSNSIPVAFFLIKKQNTDNRKEVTPTNFNKIILLTPNKRQQKNLIIVKALF